MKRSRKIGLSASMYWITSIQQPLNMTLYALSKLAEEKGYLRELLQDLSRIRRGERVAPLLLINLFERWIPGSAASYKSIFWDALCVEQLTPSIVRGLIEKLPIELRGKLAYLDVSEKIVRRKLIAKPAQIESIARVSTMDSLGVLLILALESQAVMQGCSEKLLPQQYSLYCDIVWAADFLIARLAIVPPFSVFAHVLRPVIFNSILRRPALIDIENKVNLNSTFFNEMPNSDKDIRLITNTARALLAVSAIRNFKSDCNREALQYVYDELMPLSRLSIVDFKYETASILDAYFGDALHDAIFSDSAFS